jgi:kynurenine formamidase
MSTLIDLTQDFYVGMPVYDFMIATQLFRQVTYDQIREQSGGKHVATMFGVLFCDHAGTHVDSISHVSEDPNALSIDQFPLEKFYTGAVCLDMTHIQLPEYITTRVLQQALEKAGLDLRHGDTVLLDLGHYRRYYPTRQYMGNHTGLDRPAMEWLADQGVVNIGVDSPSIEHIDMWKSNDFPAHKVCKERGMLNTENLCHLEKVAGNRFTFIGLPIPFRGGSASPIRAVAVLD